jgi:glycosyltransferase involved in cell wall biosynthesis
MGNKISVIMSVYNDQDNISNSIKSILGQTYKDFEFLIVDDCSTDNTYEEIKKFTTDPRIKLYKNSKNIGLTKSLNFLIEKSSGKYIFRQDSDDVSLSQRFQEQLNVLEREIYQVCTSRAINMQNNKTIPGLSSWVPKKISIKFKNPYIHGTLAIQKSLLNNIGNYDEDYLYAQDFKLFLDLIKKNKKIFEIKKPLYKLNTKNNISTINKDKQRSYFLKALSQTK